MNPHILALETAIPPFSFQQKNCAETLARGLNLTPGKASLLHKIFKNSKIATRYSVVEDYSAPAMCGSLFVPGLVPGTLKRNAIYKQEAPKLAHAAADKALNTWKGNRNAITHVISVSCTGMIAPGIEFQLVDSLKLSRSVERLGINFMGCFGAFKGLAVASALVRENPKNCVLVVCTELCSLHLQPDAKIDTLVSNALFGDGAAATIVGYDESPLCEIGKRASLALEDSQSDMSWEIGDHGCMMRLSPYVPQKIEQHIREFSLSLLDEKASFDQCLWAVHPGGKAVLEAVGKACELHPEQLQASWEVMEQYGNMSSPTFLFILKTLLQRKTTFPWIVGLAFGPGLSIEGILLK